MIFDSESLSFIFQVSYKTILRKRFVTRTLYATSESPLFTANTY